MMRKRTGDWRDLLSAYSLALDAKKVCMGLLAVVASVAIIALTAFVYALLLGGSESPDALAQLGMAGEEGSMLLRLMRGDGLKVIGTLSPLLNPFHGGVCHFLLSSLMYAALFWVWTGPAGVVSRLAALEYGRDDLPTLGDAREMVRRKRRAYFLAPLMPFLFVLFLCVLNVIGGFISSVPYIGRVLLILGFPLLVASTVVMVFLLVLGVLSFGMMMPAVSVGGKDGFESWSTAYSYVLWGLRRFVLYSVVAWLVFLVAGPVACGLTHLLIYLMVKTVNLGYVGGVDWISYTISGARVSVMPFGEGFPGFVLAMLFLVLRALPAAYAFSYFFTASTIIFLLMRKDQDNVDVGEVYEEGGEDEEPEALEEMPAPLVQPTQPAEPESAEPEDETAGDEDDEAAPSGGGGSDEETA